MIPVLVMLLLSILTPSIETSALENEEQPQATSGRQGSLDVDCSGYTFEDLFEYDFALFNLDINDDWATGAMDARAWVNGSKSAVVRDNLDGLFEGIAGGNDDWMSTDEREAVRSIGPKCIADMETRLGIREGIAHRGSVDWNDLEFVEDGIALDEVNLVPEDHPQERSCSSPLSATGCKEVPVTITDDLEIHLLTKAGENNNVRFDQLPNQGSSNFTLAMNITNITDARLVLTFPVEQGLRVADTGFYDDGVLQDELAAPVSEFLPDGRLRIVADVDYPLGSYPMVRNLFIDFTTMAPFTNEIPVWSSIAPAEGTIIPLGITSGEELASTEAGMWVVDESGWNLRCNFSALDQYDGWSVRMNEDASLFVTAGGDSASAQCAGVDAFGAETVEHRNYTFGTVLTATGVLSAQGDTITFSPSATSLVSSLTVTAHAHQDLNMGTNVTEVVNSQGGVMELSLTGISPGEVMVKGTATAQGMLDYTFIMDFDLEKENKPPTISIETNLQGQQAVWELTGTKFTLKGNVIDPDGQDVTLALMICDGQTTNFDRQNLAWEIQVPIANCIQNNIESPYTVDIKATDESGDTTTLTIQVVNPNSGSEDNTGEDAADGSDDESSGILPAPGLIATLLIGLVAAGWVSRRHD
tara:strand:+ start:1206 stop:3134 length:1929 start_codon:yes stop_codon:yes gene_type:complete